ncbi:hypothetical protein [Carnobacterium inhibens]|uniref:Uncharacterized protein n=2 Tax=Carnobacterium inhibens TaxID=147709 RepID=U5SCN8_9LACT|nr:hypothetical protein [Carnobacterium inhibens]AGY82811.1 hypothetical protein Q783_06055 [Carnobacterium inhibens subsp. gilichinskyi]MBC9826307.1 hypothetical protein [Carnobacterium inhibens]
MKIADSQKTEIIIQNDKALLQVTQFGSRSNKTEVTDGDTVEITSASKELYTLLLLTCFYSYPEF